MSLSQEKKEIGIILLVNFMLLVVCIAFASPYYETADDFEIISLLSGARGGGLSYASFINIFLGKSLRVLFEIFPSINWLAVYEYVCLYVSFSAVAIYIYQKMHSVLIGIFFILILAPNFYIILQFTRVAIITCSTGFLYLLGYLTEKPRTLKYYFTTLFLCLSGSMLRFDSLIMILPLFLAIALIFIFVLRKNKLEAINLKKGLSIFLCIMFLCTIDYFYVNNKYSNYNNYNVIRSNVIDYPSVNYNEYKHDFDDIGISENDYTLITTWWFDDNEKITSEQLIEIDKIQKKYENKPLDSYFKASYLKHIKTPFYVLSVIVFLFFLLSCTDYKKMLTIYSTMIVYQGLIFYFIAIRHRFPPRISESLCIAFIVLLLCVLPIQKELKQKATTLKKIAVFTICIALLFPLANANIISTSQIAPKNDDAKVFYDTLKGKSNNLYVLDNGAGMPNIYDSIHILEGIPSGYLENSIKSGSWNTNHPSNLMQKSNWNITSPIKALYCNDVFLVSAESRIYAIEQYLKEHYDKNTVCTPVKDINELVIYKISVS